MHGGEAEAGDAALALGGEEGVKNAGQHVGGDAGAGVHHLDHHVAAGGDGFGAMGEGAIQRHVAAAQREFAALLHGIARVDGEVDQHLVKLRGVGADGAAGGFEVKRQADFFAEQAAQQAGEIGDDVVDGERAGLQGLLAAEGEELAHQGGAAHGTGLDLVGVIEDFVIEAGAAGDGFRAAEYGGQQIVEIMRDAAGELAHGLQFLAVGELRLELGLQGDVNDAEQCALHGAIAPGDRIDGDADCDGAGLATAAWRRGDAGGGVADDDGAAAQELQHVRPQGGAGVVDEDLGGIGADREIGRAADQLAHGGIGALHMAVGVDHQAAEGCLVEQEGDGGVIRPRGGGGGEQGHRGAAAAEPPGGEAIEPAHRAIPAARPRRRQT